MGIADVLDECLVLVGQSWPDFEGTVRALVGRLVSAGRLPETLREKTVSAVCEREAQASTAMVDIGVSIPHVRTEGVERIACALAVAPRAVYSMAFGLPISIVALVLSSPQLANQHLEFLSQLSMLLQSASCREALKMAGSAREALEVIRGYDGRGGKSL